MAAGGLFHERREEEDTCRMAAMAFAMIRAAKLVHVPGTIRYLTSPLSVMLSKHDYHYL